MTCISFNAGCRLLARRQARTALLSLLISVLLLSCGGGDAGLPVQELPAQGLSGLPAFPVDKAGAGLTEDLIFGSDYNAVSGAAFPHDTALQLLAGESSLSWAQYRFTPGSGALDSIRANVSLEAGNVYWLALADFARQEWVLSGPHYASHTEGLDSESYRSPLGNIYLCVVCWDSVVNVESVGLRRQTVAPLEGWVTVAVDSGLNGLFGVSLISVAGSPAIAYSTDEFEGKLKYARASGTLGQQAEDWENIFIDTAESTGYMPSMAIVQGRPAIAYYDFGEQALMYALSDTIGGMLPGDWEKVQLEKGNTQQSEITGRWPSLRSVGGNPAITFLRSGPQHGLIYVRSQTPDGLDETQWEFVNVSGGLEATAFSSLTLIGNKPAVGYYAITNDQGTDGELWYAYSSTSDGTHVEDWESVRVASEGNSGVGLSLMNIDDKPYIAYYESDATSLMMAFCAEELLFEEENWQTYEVDGQGSVGEFPAAAFVDGKPVIAYVDSGNDYLKAAWALNSQLSSTSDWESLPLAIPAGIPESISIADIDGNVAIAHYDAGNKEVLYSILLEPAGP